MSTQVSAVFVDGDKNTTRVTDPVRCEAGGFEAALEVLAGRVRGKTPGRCYDVYHVRDTRRGLKRAGSPLYTWHVGEGFEHHEGWWVHVG
jgi:hypothetical protein